MHRKTVHRGIAALALVTVLALAGTPPAAAANLSFLDRIAGLWTAMTEREPATSFWGAIENWFGGAEKSSTASDPRPATERGAGLDPLGNCVHSLPGDADGSPSSFP